LWNREVAVCQHREELFSPVSGAQWQTFRARNLRRSRLLESPHYIETVGSREMSGTDAGSRL
jgi:hypothetical protein